MNRNDTSPRARFSVYVGFLLPPYSLHPKMLLWAPPARTGKRGGQCHSRTLSGFPRPVPSSSDHTRLTRLRAGSGGAESVLNGPAPPECTRLLPGHPIPTGLTIAAFWMALEPQPGCAGDGARRVTVPMASSCPLASSMV